MAGVLGGGLGGPGRRRCWSTPSTSSARDRRPGSDHVGHDHAERAEHHHVDERRAAGPPPGADVLAAVPARGGVAPRGTPRSSGRWRWRAPAARRRPRPPGRHGRRRPRPATCDRRSPRPEARQIGQRRTPSPVPRTTISRSIVDGTLLCRGRSRGFTSVHPGTPGWGRAAPLSSLRGGTVRVRRPPQRRQVVAVQRPRRRRCAGRALRLRHARPQRRRGQGARRPARRAGGHVGQPQRRAGQRPVRRHRRPGRGRQQGRGPRQPVPGQHPRGRRRGLRAAGVRRRRRARARPTRWSTCGWSSSS